MSTANAANAPPVSIHERDLRTLGDGVRVNIGVMVVRVLAGDLEDRIEWALRSVRRRWDEVASPSTPAADRKSWPPQLVEQRAAWDAWFARFMKGQADVASLNQQIQIVNAAKRHGVRDAAPIDLVVCEAPAMASAPIALVPMPAGAVPLPVAPNAAPQTIAPNGAPPGFVPAPPPAPADDEQ